MTPETFRQIPLFSTLTPEEIRDLLGQLQVIKYPAHGVIFWMEEPGDQLYIIDKGEVRISRTTREGKEFTMAILREGAFFGELSLLDGGPHTGTARAITETTLLTIDQAQFYSFLDKHPPFSRALLATLVDNLRKNSNNIRDASGSRFISQICRPGCPCCRHRQVFVLCRIVSSRLDSFSNMVLY